MKKKITFPYKIFKKKLYPIVKIQLTGPAGPLETEAYIDSGATVSIFLASIASDLGPWNRLHSRENYVHYGW